MNGANDMKGVQSGEEKKLSTAPQWNQWLLMAAGHEFDRANEQIMKWLGDNAESSEERALLSLLAHKKATRDQVARGLIACGANAMAENHASMTPLAILMLAGVNDRDCVKTLLRHCDARKADNVGTTPLMRAAGSGLAECAALLIARSEVNALDANGWDAMRWAIWGNSMECLELLLPFANPRATDKDGNSLLSVMAIGRWIEGIRRILPLSDTASRNARGLDAFDEAVSGMEHGIEGFALDTAMLFAECADLLAPFVAVDRLRKAVPERLIDAMPVARALIERADLSAAVRGLSAEKAQTETAEGDTAKKARRI